MYPGLMRKWKFLYLSVYCKGGKKVRKQTLSWIETENPNAAECVEQGKISEEEHNKKMIFLWFFSRTRNTWYLTPEHISAECSLGKSFAAYSTKLGQVFILNANVIELLKVEEEEKQSFLIDRSWVQVEFSKFSRLLFLWLSPEGT